MQQVTVYSAQKLNASQTDIIEKILKREFGASKPSYSLDKSLVAGIRIVSSNKKLELTLADILAQIGKSL